MKTTETPSPDPSVLAVDSVLPHEAIWWRQLVEQSRDGIVVLDLLGDVFWANDKFAKMLGYSLQETYELHVVDWDTVIPPAQIAEMLQNVSIDGDHFETRHRRKDGTVYDVEICTNAVQFSDLKLILCICRDITERRLQERTLHNALKQTQHLAQQLALQQDMLVQTEKLASLGELAAGVAHEINNPLSYIQSNFSCLTDYLDQLQILSDKVRALLSLAPETEPEATRTALRNLADFYDSNDIGFIVDDARNLAQENIEGARRIQKIITNLKGFARPQGSEQTLANITDIVDAALQVTHNNLKYHCTVTRRIPTDLPPILCFPVQLEQVVMNLLVNASHAIVDEGTIDISAAQVDEEHIELNIRDTGTGIPQAIIDRIFDPFFTTKDVGKGTGLGLHIVHSIVTNHGGTITVKSRDGEGTTFTLVLPVDPPTSADTV